MTLKGIVKQLQAQGHSVGYIQRKDGSIRVTSIDGIKYAKNLSIGNQVARELVGTSLTQRQKAQREKQLKGITKRRAASRAAKPRLPAISGEVRKAIRKAQRAIRRLSPGTQMTISTATVRENIKLFGEKEALRRVQRTLRYFEGYAYEDNVRWLAERIKMDAVNADSSELYAIGEWCIEHITDFKEAWITPAYEALYDLEIVLNTTSDKTERQLRVNSCCATLKGIFGI